MKIALVILNWNGKSLLEKFLPSVIKHSESADLYVIDNGSTDDSVTFLSQAFNTINVIALDRNYGFAKGYNLGLKQVNADVFCLMNNDVSVADHWLDGVEEAFKKRKLAIAQPLIMDMNRPDTFEYAGAAGGFIDAFGFPYCRGRLFTSVEKNTGQYHNALTCFWASGACFFVDSSCWEKLGGFDEDFFMHQEEIDFCWRAFNHHYTSGLLPSSKVYHQGAASLPISKNKTYFNHRNSLWMLIKNVPKISLFPVLIVRLVFDGLAAFYYLFQGKPTAFLMVIKAHLKVYVTFFKMYKKRDKTPFKRNYFHRRSIVFDYFFLRKRKFNLL